MERSPLGTIAALGIVSILVLAMMWLFTLNQVTDATAAQSALEIDQSLSRSLAAGTKSRVTMLREGKGIDAPRRYVVRYQPSAPVAADKEALGRLAERASRIVVANLEAVKGEVLIHCIAERGAAGDFETGFRRAMVSGAWDLVPVSPVPPLPTGSKEHADDEEPSDPER